MSLDDANPYKPKHENDSKGIIFGAVGGTFAGLAALFAITMLVKYHPGNQRDKQFEAEAAPASEPQASGVSNVELL